MTWSIQLTPWALPSVLAVLLVTRDLGYLWPRRREPATSALMSLGAATGVWSLLHLVAVVTASLPAKAMLTRLQLAAQAAVPLLWVWFAMAFTRRRLRRRPWPILGLALVSTVTVVLALAPSMPPWLIREVALAPLGVPPLVGIVVRHGPWYWVHVATIAAAVTTGTVVVARKLAGQRGGWRRIAWAVGAALVALVPLLIHLFVAPGVEATDPSATGFAIASTMLTAGLLHPRLLDLGPVARTLVMVQLRDPIVVLDGKGHIVDVNRAAEEVLGLRPYGDVPLPLGMVWVRSKKEPGATHTIALSAVGDTDERPFDVTVTPLGDRGTAERSAMVLRDVTERVRMEDDLRRMAAELETLAKTDVLTGLANRRSFMSALAREVERAGRYGRSLALVLLDLDHFKKVNDTWGHAAGDEVLEAAAAALKAECRDVDLAARLGGEELALLLPETDGEGARIVAERVRERIQQTPHTSGDGVPFRVTTSIGVASFGAGASTAQALLRVADEALYEAKRGGRNRVVSSSRRVT